MKRTPDRETALLDGIFRQLVLARDKWKCVKCTKAEDVAPHHIKTKKAWPQLRYEPLNAITLCADCHTLGAKSAHRSPRNFTMWIKHRWPDRFDLLTQLAQIRMKESLEDTKKRLETERDRLLED